ncbi:MAG: aminopeptidase [Pseudomonadota bacterium]
MSERLLRVILLLITGVSVASCASVGYYKQMLDGHLRLLDAREPIDELLTDQSIAPQLRSQLEAVEEIREFAMTELLLPDNGSYRSYADLDRDFVTWNVVATPELSLQPKAWCFWIAGCVNYRGYYKEESAEVFARQLRDRGYDVTVLGASAYSTLGWFDDPVLNTMLGGSSISLARVIFHELAHQKLYVSDSSAFNEAFATFVADTGVEQWLASTNRSDQIVRFRLRNARFLQFLKLLKNTQSRLTQVYTSAASTTVKRAKKIQVFNELNKDYARLRESWGNIPDYDAWFDRDLNNAHLAGISTYYDWVPAFAVMFADSGDFPAFYREAERVGSLRPSVRKKMMRELALKYVK